MDAAGRRELARLISEEGLSPREAAARLGVQESEARAEVARWYAAGRPRSASRRRLAGVGLVLAFVPVGWVASAAIFGDDETDPAGSRIAGAPAVQAPPDRFESRAARARRGRHTVSIARVPARRVKVYAKASPKAKHTTLTARKLDGRPMPLVLLVERRRGRDWLKVQLPTRPNLKTGWIRARATRLSQTTWRLRVDLSDRQVTTWRGKRKISVHRIGVGRSVSPTPRGRYYLTDLVKPPDPNGLYGAYAFGLSAHSNVYTSFGTGDGQIGIHGTNDPRTLGSKVSHGCIRVSNDVIESFARHLPLGTPVTIRS